MTNGRNIDERVTGDFGKEWSRFDQSELPDQELRDAFAAYFGIFPWDKLPSDAKGFDLGCGSGRWAKLVAPRVGELHCIEPSGEAMEVARKNLADYGNCRFHPNSVDDIPLDDETMDFGYSLGVLHHVPDTAGGIESCARKLKPGAPFLDDYRPSLLDEGLYFADGQIRDEVYVWGSFLQSKMYANDVRCDDCHNVHSLELHQQGKLGPSSY